jgi:hypothetical protein
MEFVPDGVLGGYGRGTGVVRSTWRVLPRSWEMVMCDLTWLPWSKQKGVSPFPRDFDNNLVFEKNFFNKDIEMSYDMLYRQEKTC